MFMYMKVHKGVGDKIYTPIKHYVVMQYLFKFKKSVMSCVKKKFLMVVHHDAVWLSRGENTPIAIKSEHIFSVPLLIIPPPSPR